MFLIKNKCMKKNISLITISFIISAVACGQKIEGVAGFIQLGYLNAPYTKVLNQVYPAGFNDTYFSVGAEGFYRKNKNLIIGEWQFGLQKVYSFNDKHAGAVYEALLGKYGRIIKDKNSFWLYPSAGAGLSFISLTSYEDINKQNTATQTLVSPTFDFGMNADILLSKRKGKEDFYFGWIMGIKAGCRFAIKSDNWKDDTNDAVNKKGEMPSYTNNAFYITLSIGGGSVNKK